MKALFPVALALVLNLQAAGGDEPRVTTYAVYSKGLRVGTVHAGRERVLRDGRDMVSCRITTEIHVRIPFFRYSLHNEEDCLIDERGAVEYKQVRNENGNHQTIHGVLERGVFRFTVSEKGGVRSVDIPRDQYAMTSMDSAELKLVKPGEVQNLRILDLNLLALVERSYHWVKNEKMAMGGKSVLSRVVDYADPNKKIRRWVTEDDVGLLVMRQEGREKAGHYTMRQIRSSPRFPAGTREVSVGLSVAH